MLLVQQAIVVRCLLLVAQSPDIPSTPTPSNGARDDDVDGDAVPDGDGDACLLSESAAQVTTCGCTYRQAVVLVSRVRASDGKKEGESKYGPGQGEGGSWSWMPWSTAPTPGRGGW